MAIYKAKVLLVDAFKWTGGRDQDEDPVWITVALRKEWGLGAVLMTSNPPRMKLHHPDGTLTAQPGDYIIRDADGSLRSMSPSVFEATYESAMI